jgi:hypothetical protein
MERKKGEGFAINDYWALKTTINADASSILQKYLFHQLINVERVGGPEKMFEACVEGLLDAAAKTASQGDLDTDKVTAILNRKMQERGVKTVETKSKQDNQITGSNG